MFPRRRRSSTASCIMPKSSRLPAAATAYAIRHVPKKNLRKKARHPRKESGLGVSPPSPRLRSSDSIVKIPRTDYITNNDTKWLVLKRLLVAGFEAPGDIRNSGFAASDRYSVSHGIILRKVGSNPP